MNKDTASIVKRFKKAQDRLVLQAADLSLETISAMVDNESIDIAPGYQRRERWDHHKQAALIESLLLNVPVPPVYLAEDDYGTYSVIDGKQRITAIHLFMRNDLTLSGLERFSELQGRRFSELPRELQSALTVRPYIRAVTLLKQSDPELKYEVFSRLNTGGVALNAQEVRNVAFRGPLNDLVYELSDNVFLRQQLKIQGAKSSAYKSMLDAEYVVRFLALSPSWESFSGDFRRTMDTFMSANRDSPPKDLAELGTDFSNAIAGCESLWGNRAFQRPAKDGWRDQTLSGMYDAQMIALSQFKFDAEDLSSHRSKAIDMTRALFEDEEFEQSVRSATNTPSRVKYRIERMTDVVSDLIT